MRIGNEDFTNDEIAEVLEILNATIHPAYDRRTSYFNLAVLETKPLEFRQVKDFSFSPITSLGCDETILSIGEWLETFEMNLFQITREH